MMPLTNSKDCENYLRNIWKFDTINYEERVYVVFLNSKGYRMDFKLLEKGRYSQCDLHPEKIAKLVKKAIKLKSKFIVVAHNHPCGDATPSENDRISTCKLINILEAMDITLMDHIILTEDSYFSFKDAGIIEGYHRQSYGPGKIIPAMVGIILGILSLCRVFNYLELSAGFIF